MTVFHVPEDALPLFRTPFQQGLGVTIQTGISLEDLLCCQSQIDRAHVMDRICTLFLYGKPVDGRPASSATALP